MRDHAAANESPKLALHERGGVALILVSVDLEEEGLEVLADDAVENPMLRRAKQVGSRNLILRSGSAKRHNRSTPSKLVPWSTSAFSTRLRSFAFGPSGERRRNAGGRHPWRVCGLALPGVPRCE